MSEAREEAGRIVEGVPGLVGYIEDALLAAEDRGEKRGREEERLRATTLLRTVVWHVGMSTREILEAMAIRLEDPTPIQSPDGEKL